MPLHTSSGRGDTSRDAYVVRAPARGDALTAALRGAYGQPQVTPQFCADLLSALNHIHR